MDWFDSDKLGAVLEEHGFRRRGKQNWVRKTRDFVQLFNLQKSAWSKDVNYLNFALWPLELGEPPSIAESKFPFRKRVDDLESVVALADGLKSLDLNCVFSKLSKDTGSCILVLHASKNLQMDAVHSRVVYQLLGAEADRLKNEFLAPASGNEIYRSSDGLLALTALTNREGELTGLTLTYGH